MADPTPAKTSYPIRYDAVVKDLFQRDRPSILDAYTGGRTVRGFLNVEFAMVEERVADLLIELGDGAILHIEFQSANHSAMPYRMGIYGLLAAEKYRGRKVEQVLLYVGQNPLSMSAALDIGEITVRYKLIDIREFSALDLLASGRPGDYALALLASGGVEHMRLIIEQACQLPEEERRRVIAQMAVLSGLRGVSESFRMEVKAMGVNIDFEENVILKEIFDTGFEKGREQGIEQGMERGMAKLLRRQVEERFGPLPDWASTRIQSASPAEIEQWASRVISAPTLDAALGL